MKRLFLVIVIVANALMVFDSFASGRSEDVRQAEAFQYCVDDCLSTSDPTYEIRACINECKKRYLPPESDDETKPQFCNSYEEDCQRDTDDNDEDRDDNEDDASEGHS